MFGNPDSLGASSMIPPINMVGKAPALQMRLLDAEFEARHTVQLLYALQAPAC